MPHGHDHVGHAHGHGHGHPHHAPSSDFGRAFATGIALIDPALIVLTSSLGVPASRE
jgi:cobalt-zinc-cadmium efflux system protein